MTTNIIFNMTKIPSAFWIDTDPGLDDGLAILFALQEVGPKLVGFSSAQGNASEAVAARNLGRLLSHFEAEGLSPANWQPRLVRGRPDPLVRKRLEMENVHGADGLGDLPWQASPAYTAFLDEKPLGLETALADYDKLRLICLAPLTNLAAALQNDPTLVGRIEQLVIMGGSLRAGGNSSMAAEYNFYADPEAAALVLEAGFKEIWLIPTDAPLTARMRATELARLDSLDNPLARCVGDLLSAWHERILSRGQGMYDLMAWFAAIHPEWVEWQPLYVAVDTAGGLAYGASIADWRGRSGKPPNVRAALSIAPDKVWNYFFQVLDPV